MKFSRQEVNEIIQLLYKEVDKVGRQIVEVDGGRDTEETRQRVRELDDRMGLLCRIAEKFEDMIVNSYQE